MHREEGGRGQVNRMDDLIHRREVIAALGERPLVWVGSDYELGARNQYDCDRLAVETTPTVDAVPVIHGRWKRKIVDCGFNADWVCSQCGHRVMTDFVNYKYCPECGARMDR